MYRQPWRESTGAYLRPPAGEGMTMGLFDPDCGEPHDDVTSIVCNRPAGHQGEHEGVSIVTWSDDD